MSQMQGEKIMLRSFPTDESRRNLRASRIQLMRPLMMLVSCAAALIVTIGEAGGPVALRAQTIQTNQAAQSVPPDQSVLAAYYYKIKWGYQDEFMDLFRRNHYPVLEAQLKSGRLLRVDAYTPRYHGDGHADWNFVTILVFKNWQAFGDRSEEEAVIKRLYPDQERYKKEEQRRFQLLDAHWDVPLVPMPMK